MQAWLFSHFVAFLLGAGCYPVAAYLLKALLAKGAEKAGEAIKKL